MTNEEAINHIEDMANALQIFPDSKQGQAILRAIEVLEQEPCDDVVSLKAVIEWLKTKDIIKLSSQEETARKELKWLREQTKGE